MIRRMSISPEFILHLQHGALAIVIANALPADANIVKRGYDSMRDEFYCDVQSNEFTDETPLTPILRRVDPTNIEDREVLRAELARGAGG